VMPLLDRQAEAERSADADPGRFQPDAAAHLFDYHLGDVKSEPGAADRISGQDAVAGLLELAEKLGLGLRRHAAAGIADRSLDAVGSGREADGHAAILGKLQGVADQVD